MLMTMIITYQKLTVTSFEDSLLLFFFLSSFSGNEFNTQKEKLTKYPKIRFRTKETARTKYDQVLLWIKADILILDASSEINLVIICSFLPFRVFLVLVA